MYLLSSHGSFLPPARARFSDFPLICRRRTIFFLDKIVASFFPLSLEPPFTVFLAERSSFQRFLLNATSLRIYFLDFFPLHSHFPPETFFP